jgi:hypothetical protein
MLMMNDERRLRQKLERGNRDYETTDYGPRDGTGKAECGRRKAGAKKS